MDRILSHKTLTWTLQTLLAIVFLLHGLMFLNPPPEIAVLMNASMFGLSSVAIVRTLFIATV